MFLYGLYAIEARKWDLNRSEIEIEPLNTPPIGQLMIESSSTTKPKYSRPKSYSISCTHPNVAVQNYSCKIFVQNRYSSPVLISSNKSINISPISSSSINYSGTNKKTNSLASMASHVTNNKYETNLKNFESYVTKTKRKSNAEELNKLMGTCNFSQKSIDQNTDQTKSTRRRRATSMFTSRDIICNEALSACAAFRPSRKSVFKLISQKSFQSSDIYERVSKQNENIPLESESKKYDVLMPMARDKPSSKSSKSKKYLREIFSKFKSYSLNE
jgi:hypothetical protein